MRATNGHVSVAVRPGREYHCGTGADGGRPERDVVQDIEADVPL